MPGDIQSMSNEEVGAALAHVRRSYKVPYLRQQQLQAEWTKRLAALDD